MTTISYSLPNTTFVRPTDEQFHALYEIAVKAADVVAYAGRTRGFEGMFRRDLRRKPVASRARRGQILPLARRCSERAPRPALRR